MRKFLALFLVFVSLLPVRPVFAAAEIRSFDHSSWDAFLKKYVNDKGEINFAEAKKDPSLLDDYLAKIKELNEFSMTDWPREEAIAFWINAYHAAAVAQVLKYYPVKSVQEIPGYWETKFLQTFHAEAHSLNEMRDQQLINAYRDEKVHFALSSMSKSGPVLIRDAYTGPKLDGQLFSAARKFVNDTERNNINPQKKKVELSRLFKWYGGDFQFNFGKPENDRHLSIQEFSLMSFIVYYLEDAAKVQFLEDGRYKIKYLPFDWRLNDWHS